MCKLAALQLFLMLLVIKAHHGKRPPSCCCTPAGSSNVAQSCHNSGQHCLLRHLLAVHDAHILHQMLAKWWCPVAAVMRCARPHCRGYPGNGAVALCLGTALFGSYCAPGADLAVCQRLGRVPTARHQVWLRCGHLQRTQRLWLLHRTRCKTIQAVMQIRCSEMHVMPTA